MQYTEEFKKVMEFYLDSTPKQKLMFIDLISDKLTFFDTTDNICYDIDEEAGANMNGIFYQINIKQ